MTMTWIAGQTVGAGGVSVVSFPNIPQTFTHLQLRFTHRSASSSPSFILFVINNTYGGTQYAFHYLRGNGSSPSANGFADQSRYEIGTALPNSTSASGIFDAGIIDILDYANTNKNKTFRTLMGFDANGSGIVEFSSGLWKANTNAIMQIDLYDAYGNFAQNSRIDLYGITVSDQTGA